MSRLSHFVVRHRLLVSLFWLVMFVAGAAGSGAVGDRLVFDFSLPGQQGYETDREILETYGNSAGSFPAYIPVLTVPDGTTVEEQADEIAGVFREVQQALPHMRLVDYAMTKDDVFVTDDGRSTYALIFPPVTEGFGPGPEVEIKPVLAEQAQATGFDLKLTSYFMLSAGEDVEAPSLFVETMFGALGALVVLVFVFASFLALVPLIVAAVSILSTFLIVLLLTTFTEVSFVVQFLIALVGLGVAIDYSLLVVTRWREEREHGRDNVEAVHESVRTAGHAVVASALTVAISLIALLVVPVPLLRSMGIGGVLIPLVSTAVCLTLLPAMLSKIGPRVDWPRLRHEGHASRPWTAWSRGVIRYRWPAAIAATAVLVALFLPVFGIKIGQPRTESLATAGPAYEALQTLKDGGVPPGIVSTLDVLVRGDDPDRTVDEVVDAAVGVDGIATAFAPEGEQWRKDGSALVAVVPERETVDNEDSKIADNVLSAVTEIDGVVGVAGTGAVVLDYLRAVYDRFPLVLTIIALITYVLLVRQFRSLLLPAKALVLNLLSVGATFGATVLFWQHGYGSDEVFDIASTGVVTFWLPVLIFAFLFGLSMDYEVFILARMREEYDETHSTPAAIVTGLGRTGRLVTSAALILCLAFVALAATPGTDIKIFATALGFGILLDATIVRAVLVPALVSLFGKWNWWLPDNVARILRVEPSPLRSEVGSHRAAPPRVTEPV